MKVILGKAVFEGKSEMAKCVRKGQNDVCAEFRWIGPNEWFRYTIDHFMLIIRIRKTDVKNHKG